MGFVHILRKENQQRGMLIVFPIESNPVAYWGFSFLLLSSNSLRDLRICDCLNTILFCKFRVIRMHKCMVCNEKFLNKDALEEHKILHTTIKPFECTYCGYKSSLKDILRNHIKIQHGVLVNRNDIISLKKYEM